MDKWDETRMEPAVPVTDEEFRQELADMTQDVQLYGEEVRGLRTQLANALTLAARAALPTPQTTEDTGQKFPHSPDYSGLKQTQLSPRIAQL